MLSEYESEKPYLPDGDELPYDPQIERFWLVSVRFVMVVMIDMARLYAAVVLPGIIAKLAWPSLRGARAVSQLLYYR